MCFHVKLTHRKTYMAHKFTHIGNTLFKTHTHMYTHICKFVKHILGNIYEHIHVSLKAIRFKNACQTMN